MKVHLTNAGKYFSSLCFQGIALIKAKNICDTTYNLYILIGIVATLYGYIWDLYMDWGLLRSNKPGKKFLRSKILYPSWFYYYAIISNFILRFFWIFQIFAYDRWIENS